LTIAAAVIFGPEHRRIDLTGRRLELTVETSFSACRRRTSFASGSEAKTPQPAFFASFADTLKILSDPHGGIAHGILGRLRRNRREGLITICVSKNDCFLRSLFQTGGHHS